MPRLVGDALRWHALHSPDKEAVVSSSGSMSYLTFWRRTLRVADALSLLGVKTGTRVGLMLQNGPEYLELYHAVALLGAAAVPLNTRFVASEVTYVLEHSGAQVLIFDASLRATVLPFYQRAQARHVQFVAVNSNLADAKTWATMELQYEEMVARGSATDWSLSADADSCYFQGYTSGTTGFPKGCVNPQGAFTECLRRIRSVYGISPTDIELVAAPLFHEAPVLFALAQILSGGTVVVTPDSTPEVVFDLIQRHRVTWAFMVPTMWTTMVDSPALSQFDLSSLRSLLSGGSPLSTRTKEALLDRIPQAGLNEFYGATEVGLVSNLGPKDQRRKVRSVGKPVEDMYVQLRDEHGRPVRPGEIGEIYVGGETLIREYFLNPEATAQSRGEGGYFTLGDMGRFDEEGYLYIVDRKKDMIISGGENIFPNDIEDVLNQHPAVQMVAVVGAPDDRWGEIVVAAVVLKSGQLADEAELLAHCRLKLAGFKVPKRIQFRDGIPLSAFGKILRREIREEFWADHEVRV